jgi:hypothetical protein
MQVSQQSDQITHAVIGNQETVEMGVSDSSALMHILSTALYTYPKLAAVREIMCNGWDGNISAGTTDKPLMITISDTEISIKDSGLGIPHEKIGEIYGTYGNSTKRDDSTVTGGFGLGSKAPFAYTDNFEVISCHAGVKTIYRISKSSMAKGGKPAINKIISLPTEESGITVTMALKPRDRDNFLDLVKEVATLGEIPVSINGQKPIEVLPLSASPTGYIINSFDGTLTTRINVRYGNVVYPIPRDASYIEDWDRVDTAIGNLWNSANIIFACPPDSVSIQPSRESLILTEGTVATIKSLLAKFNVGEITRANKSTKEVMRWRVNQAVKLQDLARVPNTITNGLDVSRIRFPFMGDDHESGPFAYTVRRASISSILHRERSESGVDPMTMMLKRLRHWVSNGDLNSYDIKYVKKLMHEMSVHWHTHSRRTHRHNQIWRSVESLIQRFYVLPVKAKVLANENISPDRFGVAQRKNVSFGNIQLTPTKNLVVGDIQDALDWMEPKVLLVRNKTAIHERLYHMLRYDVSHLGGWYIYMMPAHPKNHDSIRKTFADAGFEIHEYGLEAKPRAEKLVDPDAVPAAPKPPKPKRKGYLTLADAYNPEDGSFLLSHAREHGKPEESVLKPIAWTACRTKVQGAERLTDMSDVASLLAYKMFGKQIAVVTSMQAEVLTKKGVPELKTYIYQHVDDKLSTAKDFPRWLAFNRHLESYESHSNLETNAAKLLEAAVGHEDLVKDLGLRFSVSADTQMLLKFFKDSSERSERVVRERLPKSYVIASKVKRSPQTYSIPRDMAASPWAKYLNLNQLAAALSCHAPGSPQTNIPYELVRKLFN